MIIILRVMLKINRIGLLFCLGLLTWSCEISTEQKEEGSQPKSQPIKRYLNVEQPTSSRVLEIGDTVQFKLVPIELDNTVDSVAVYLNKEHIYSGSQFEFSIRLTPPSVGSNKLLVMSFSQGIEVEKKTMNLYFRSDIQPKAIQYQLINQYPHATSSFTQGLVFHNGYIYEGTGEWGKSKLLQTDLLTGEPLKSVSLEVDKFGEGIELVGNKIVQLTYKAREGYVYNKETFELLKTFTYPTPSEGWGLASDGEVLFMSNGSHKIMVLDTLNYSFIKEFEVYDNQGRVDQLNELECHKGVLFANIWNTEKIAAIDPKTGKVLGYINLSAIVPNKYKNHREWVPNGIAVDTQTGHFFVTGKKWDQLFEIKLDSDIE